jgi:hypothetical protein
MEYLGLLGLFLGALDHKLVVAGDRGLGVEVVGQSLVEEHHRQLRPPAPRLENLRNSPSRPSPSSRFPYL